MTDTLTVEKRSWVMSRIRGKNTKPERIVRSLLHGMGYRFTVNGPHNRKLPGRPDIVLPKWKAVVLVHGCFWHGHRDCKHFRLPKTRTAWWKKKIDGNRARDERNRVALRALGWNVIEIWECETKAKSLDALADKLDRNIRKVIRYDFGTTEESLKVAEEPDDEN